MPQPHQKRRPQNRRVTNPNKSQQREAAVRAEQMAAEPSPELVGTVADIDATPESAGDAPIGASVNRAKAQVDRSSQRERRRGENVRPRPAVAVPVVSTITHEQEYAFIRADLRRLLMTAGAVLVLMLALLFVIEG